MAELPREHTAVEAVEKLYNLIIWSEYLHFVLNIS